MKVVAHILLSGWVLWLAVGDASDPAGQEAVWGVVDAWDTRRECHENLAQRIAIIKNTPSNSGEETSQLTANTFMSKSKDGRTARTQFLCLPSEVDPRPVPHNR